MKILNLRQQEGAFVRRTESWYSCLDNILLIMEVVVLNDDNTSLVSFY